MSDTIRLYVGTDPQQHVAEKALAASVAAHTSGPVEIHWMRQGDPGWDWGGLGAGWATPFTFFRWAIPEASGHKGRAIYMDVDMLALGDLRELWEWDLKDHFVATTRRPEVIVWDCEKAPPLNWQPEHRAPHKLMHKRIAGCPILPDVWDVKDRYREGTKILHYTALRTQPWHPYRGRFTYTHHPDPKACAVFWWYALKGHGMDPEPFESRPAGEWCAMGEQTFLVASPA